MVMRLMSFFGPLKNIFMGSLTRVFRLCQETHRRPFSVANSSNIAFEVPLASELFVAIWPYISEGFPIT